MPYTKEQATKIVQDFFEYNNSLDQSEQSFILFNLLVENKTSDTIAKNLSLMTILFSGLEAIRDNKDNDLVFKKVDENIDNLHTYIKKMLELSSSKDLILNVFKSMTYEKTH